MLRWSPDLTVILQRLHFTDVETEAQRGRQTYLRSHSKVGAKSGPTQSLVHRIRYTAERAEFTNGDFGELESRLFLEICVHTDRLRCTDLHFDSRGS